MLRLTEVKNLRAFLMRVTDLKANESTAHALCLQALDAEEAAIGAAMRKAQADKLRNELDPKPKSVATPETLPLSDIPAREPAPLPPENI